MKLEDCKNISDSISAVACRIYFQDAIRSYDDSIIEKKEFLELLVELTDRQCQTYEVLDEETRNQLDGRIASIWNTDNYDDVDCIIYIVANIGLVKTYEKIINSLECDKQIDDEILKEIQEFIDESKGDISNPYRFL